MSNNFKKGASYRSMIVLYQFLTQEVKERFAFLKVERPPYIAQMRRLITRSLAWSNSKLQDFNGVASSSRMCSST